MDTPSENGKATFLLSIPLAYVRTCCSRMRHTRQICESRNASHSVRTESCATRLRLKIPPRWKNHGPWCTDTAEFQTTRCWNTSAKTTASSPVTTDSRNSDSMRLEIQ